MLEERETLADLSGSLGGVGSGNVVEKESEDAAHWRGEGEDREARLLDQGAGTEKGRWTWFRSMRRLE